MTEPKNIISLGAGVQSTTMALMAAHGEITPMPDAAIFADTGAEPKAVYDHLDWLMSPNVLPFPVEVVRAGDIIADAHRALHGRAHRHGRAASAPYFTLGKDGGAAPLRRQCTGAYKVDPINARLREIVCLPKGARSPKDGGLPRIRVWIGISHDEVHRIKRAREWWQERCWPLAERRMSRGHCLEWLRANDYPDAPRSACTICPYRSREEWRHLRETDADGWNQAVAHDREIRQGFKRMNSDADTGALFLHRSLRPLDEVDLTDPHENQLDLWQAECEGMCGV